MTTPKKISCYVRVAELAYSLAQVSFLLYRRRKSKKMFGQPQLAACVLLMIYVDLSYRDLEEWLRASDQVCAALALTRILDHCTLNRAFHRLTETRLQRLLTALLKQLDVNENVNGGRLHALQPEYGQRVLPHPELQALSRLTERFVSRRFPVPVDFGRAGESAQQPSPLTFFPVVGMIATEHFKTL